MCGLAVPLMLPNPLALSVRGRLLNLRGSGNSRNEKPRNITRPQVDVLGPVIAALPAFQKVVDVVSEMNGGRDGWVIGWVLAA